MLRISTGTEITLTCPELSGISPTIGVVKLKDAPNQPGTEITLTCPELSGISSTIGVGLIHELALQLALSN